MAGYVVIGSVGQDPKTGVTLYTKRFLRKSHTDDLPGGDGWFKKEFAGEMPDEEKYVWDEVKAIYVAKG